MDPMNPSASGTSDHVADAEPPSPPTTPAAATTCSEEENSVGQKKTVHQRAAVLLGMESGMDLGAAARSAGVSLETVRAWREENARFDAAIVAVRAMGRRYGNSPQIMMTPARAHIVLHALRDGETLARAAELAGVALSTVYHRKKHAPAFRALMEEAQEMGLHTRARRRGQLRLRNAKYRLVRPRDDDTPG
jgi:transposase-like protein